jgi:hypothetical protein
MEVFLNVCLWVLAGWLVFGGLGAVALIGKERKPWTPGQAIFALIVNGFFATILVVTALTLARYV